MIGETVPIPEPSSESSSEVTPIEPFASEPVVDVKEIGGRDGPDPTRYGDWEKNGRCIDF